MAQVKITVRPNGPYRVEAPEGTIELVDASGTPFDLTGKTAFSLCRCGGSVNKPFCAGTHNKIGVNGREPAGKKTHTRAAPFPRRARHDLFPGRNQTLGESGRQTTPPDREDTSRPPA